MNDMLQRLEDKIVHLVDELESLRNKMRAMIKENQELQHQAQELKAQASNNQEKLRGIVSLLDSVENRVNNVEAASQFKQEEAVV